MRPVLSRIVLVLALIVCVIGKGRAAASEPAAPSPEPVVVVEKLHGALLEAMREAESLRFQGRYDRLLPVVDEVYDLPRIARMTVGRHWEEFDEQQREQLADRLRELTAATYADRFDGYGGESFEVVEHRSLRSDRELVVSMLVPSKKKDRVRFDYVLERDDKHWKIINVVTDGVSEVALKRSQYTEFLEADGHGPDDLIAKIADLARYRREHAQDEEKTSD